MFSFCSGMAPHKKHRRPKNKKDVPSKQPSSKEVRLQLLKGGLIRGYTNFKLINLMNYQVINLTSFNLLQQESLL